MVNNSDTKVSYQGNGQTTVFPFSFPFIQRDYIKVAIYDSLTDETKTIDSDYYVDTVANTVIYPGYEPGQEPAEALRPPILPATSTITIYRQTDVDQLTDLGEKYPHKDIENMADKLTEIIQEQAETLGRTVKVPVGDPKSPEEKLTDLQNYVSDAANSAKNAADSEASAQRAAEAAATSDANAAESERLASGYADTATDAASRAEDSAISARAYNAPDYDNTVTYQAGEVVTYTDGNSYRALQETTGHEPPNIIYWQKVTDYVGDDFFEVDEYGYIVPMDSPSHSRYWRVDQNGYIVPIEGGDGGYRPDTRSLSAEYLNVTNEGYVKHLRADDITAQEVDADEMTAEVAAFNALTANAVNAGTLAANDIIAKRPVVDVRAFNGESYADKVQNAVDNIEDGGIIILSEGTIDKVINLPIDKSITFISTAQITISATVGFLRTTPTVDGITSTIVFDNINFINSTNDSVCIKDKVKFYSGGNRGIKVTNCTFSLTGSAVGVELTGSMFNDISHNTFIMSANCIGVCLKGDTADVYRWAMNSNISDNTFKGGHSIKSELNTGFSFEGLNVLNNEFFTSPIELDNISLANISCNTFISSPLYITSVFDAHINNNYFDTAEKGLPLISLSNTSSNYLWGVTIEGNHFSRYGYGGNCVEINGNSSNVCQNISFIGNSYNGFGQINPGTVDPTDPTERMFGIVNNNPGAKNILIAEENFNHLYSAITLNEQITRSTIDKFEANDTKFYLQNPENATTFSRVDNLYKVIPIDIMIPYYVLGNTTDVIYNENINYDTMLATPSITFTPSYQSSNITYSVSSSDKNTKITIRKTASETSTGDWPRAALSGTLTIDATQNTHR